MNRHTIITLVLIYWFFAFVILFCGCASPQGPANASLDSMLEVTAALRAANLASAPVNPYFLPVSVALSGIAAMLEALRRKERAGRKHAEHKLNNGNNNERTN